MLEDYAMELTPNPGAGQAITATAFGGTPYQLTPGDDPAAGEPLSVLYQVLQNFNTLTSLAVNLLNDDDGAGANAITVLTKSIVLANLTVAAGAARLGLVPPQVLTKKFLTGQFVVTGSNPTTGKIRMWLQKGADVIPINAGAM